MTEAQSLMLAICCGTSIGWVVGAWISLIIAAISELRKRHRDKKANKSQ